MQSDPIRPYSLQAWRERQRQYRIQQEYRRRVTRIAGVCLALIVAAILLGAVLKTFPDDWDDQVEQTGKEWLQDR